MANSHFAKRLFNISASVVLAGALALPMLPASAQTMPKVQADERIVPFKDAPADFSDLAEGLMESVVNISTTQTVEGRERMEMPELPPGSPFQEFFEEFFNRQQQQGPRSRKASSLGSGFVVDASGIIITNNHVIDGADEIEVNFSDGTKLAATVIGTDPKTDLAVLKVNPEKPLKSVSFGKSDELRIGQWVMAIGNPFGFGGTVTVGIVSAMNRDIRSGPYDDFIQTDASINRGNSGGPLFNMKGEVVGINTAIVSPTGGSIGLGFSIPSNLASSVVSQIVEFGETRRGWLGVRIQPVTDEIAESMGLSKAAGALVASLDPEGPAFAADVQVGDVILTYDGKAVNEMRELPRYVAETPVGTEVDVEVFRRGKRETLKVTIARLNEAVAEAETPANDNEPAVQEQGPMKLMGLSLVGIDNALREQFDLPEDTTGVVITDLDAESPAAEGGLVPGEVIQEVNQEAVETPQQVADIVAKLKEDGRSRALLLVRGLNGDPRFATLPIE